MFELPETLEIALNDEKGEPILEDGTQIIINLNEEQTKTILYLFYQESFSSWFVSLLKRIADEKISSLSLEQKD